MKAWPASILQGDQQRVPMAVVTAELPAGAVAVYFNATDSCGLNTSSPCFFPGGAASPKR